MKMLVKRLDSQPDNVKQIGPCTLYLGDCLEVLKTFPDNSIDAIVTDPPAGIGFMGKEWDDFRRARNESDTSRNNQFGRLSAKGPQYARRDRDNFIEFLREVMREALRVLKPGGHALVWAIPRTSHWTATACEDAGFEIRDRVSHLFGTGFPKSMDVSKAIDKAAGKTRTDFKPYIAPDGKPRPTVVSDWAYTQDRGESSNRREAVTSTPATPEAAQWEGWGTALKPACEDWWLCRKPLEGTVAANVLKYGTGAINIDGCRVEGSVVEERGEGWARSGLGKSGAWHGTEYVEQKSAGERCSPLGRFPANLIHDGSDEVLEGFPDTGISTGGRTVKRSGGGNVGSGKASEAAWSNDDPGYGDSGSAARFFYCTKASKKDRNEGGVTNKHPTVKNTELMRYLCRLITPPGGTILDMFAGSFSTGKAAIREGFKFIGIEAEQEYFDIGIQRIKHEIEQLS